LTLIVPVMMSVEGTLRRQHQVVPAARTSAPGG